MVFKINKNRNYTVMSNYHLKDKNISFKAKGLLSFMLSLPEDWDYSINGLVAISKENRNAIKNTLNELKDNYYLEIEKIRDDKGWFTYNYVIYENPQILQEKQMDNPEPCFPPLDYREVEEPEVDNQLQINTKEQIDKIDKSKSKENDNHFMTNYLIESCYIKEDEFYLSYYNDMFKNMLNNYDNKEVISATHYIVKNMKARDFLDENGDEIENKYGYLKKSILSNIEKLESFNECENEIDWLSDVIENDLEY